MPIGFKCSFPFSPLELCSCTIMNIIILLSENGGRQSCKQQDDVILFLSLPWLLGQFDNICGYDWLPGIWQRVTVLRRNIKRSCISFESNLFFNARTTLPFGNALFQISWPSTNSSLLYFPLICAFLLRPTLLAFWAVPLELRISVSQTLSSVCMFHELGYLLM